MDGSAPSASGQGALALQDWERPPRHQSGPATAPVLAVDGFEGPLDWLLDLARTRRIDLARLSIVALVEAFAEALMAALATPDQRPPRVGRGGDWLVMAADLTLLRTRLLVPADAAAAQDARNEGGTAAAALGGTSGDRRRRRLAGEQG
jgi:segregation and condensation protein A